jgi:hypothetical protein
VLLVNPHQEPLPFSFARKSRPSDLVRVARRKLDQLNQAVALGDLRAHPSNHLARRDPAGGVHQAAGHDPDGTSGQDRGLGTTPQFWLNGQLALDLYQASHDEDELRQLERIEPVSH